MEHIHEFLNRYPWIGLPLRLGVLILLVITGTRLIRIACGRILKSGPGERDMRVQTLVRLMDTTLRVILVGAAFLMALREVGLDITPLLTGAGIAGVALGLGAQTLVKDVIAGFFLLAEDQIRIGDAVRISGFSGKVERMELRITVLRDEDGALHIIPNSEIKAVTNYSTPK